jgi:rhodanese-related sulfurtransferase
LSSLDAGDAARQPSARPLEVSVAIIPVRELVERANAEVATLSPTDALAAATGGRALLVDIRDIRELEREGRIAGAYHAPRGMLEFWFDPSSPYFRPALGDLAKTYVLFCAAGWRSALAAKALKDMGFPNIAHVAGGFGALRENGATVEPGDRKTDGKF